MLTIGPRSPVVLVLLLTVLHSNAQDTSAPTAMTASTRAAAVHDPACEELSVIRAWLDRYPEIRPDPMHVKILPVPDHDLRNQVTIDAPDLRTIRATTMMFNPYSADIDTSYMPWLDHVATLLHQHPRARMRIEAHTDSIGTEEENEMLSWQRARLVEVYLLEHRVAPEQLTTAGYGEHFPIASNAEYEGRCLNRRVELRITLMAP
jgi:outer membrane protein OmpA-like peptidoglycan-associated protein